MRLRRLVVIAAAIGLVTAACGEEGSGEPTVLDVTTRGFAFEGVADTFEGGVVTVNFDNEHTVAHEIGFWDIGDASFDDFKRDFPALIEGGPFPEFLREGPGAFPLEVEPGASMSTTFSLPAGDYLMLCALTGSEGDEDGPPHYELGMVQDVTVTGGSGSLPDVPTIEARDYTFDVPELEAGRQELIFRNAGPDQWHHLVAMEFPEGVDESAARSAFETSLELDEGQAPPEGTPEGEEIGFAGVFSPGGEQVFELDFQSGRTYLFACFIHDLDGGPPHAIAHDMITTFTVG